MSRKPKLSKIIIQVIDLLQDDISIDRILSVLKSMNITASRSYVSKVIKKLEKSGQLYKINGNKWSKYQNLFFEEIKVGKQYLYIIQVGSEKNPVVVRSKQKLTKSQVFLRISYDQLYNTLTSPDYIGKIRFEEKLKAIDDNYLRKAIPAFVESQKLVILPNGNLLGYKYICELKDGTMVSCYDKKTVHKFNEPVEVEEVDPNHNIACSKGLHVAGIDYLQYMPAGSKVIAVEVEPIDIASIPYGEEGKMRVKRYIPRILVSKSDKVNKQSLVSKLINYVHSMLLREGD